MGVLEDVLLRPEPGPDDRFTWATVTGMSPLRVQLDGETAPLAITPELCCAVWVGARVWCQINHKQLIVLAASQATLLGVTKAIRHVGSAKRTTSTSNATGLFNVTTFTLPQALTVTGFKFRISAAANIVPDTAGSYTDFQLLIGPNASVGGTWLAGYYVDHRIAGRIVEATIPNFDYTYAETQDHNNMNIVLVCNPSAGSYISASSVRPAYLTVDWIMP